MRWEQAFSLWYMRFWVFRRIFDAQTGARTWIGTTTLLWGFLSAAMAWADTEAKFLIVRTLLGAAEAGFFPGMIYLTSQWFPQRNRASIMGLFYMGAPLALTLGSPLSGALLEMHGFMGSSRLVLDVCD